MIQLSKCSPNIIFVLLDFGFQFVSLSIDRVTPFKRHGNNAILFSDAGFESGIRGKLTRQFVAFLVDTEPQVSAYAYPFTKQFRQNCSRKTTWE